MNKRSIFNSSNEIILPILHMVCKFFVIEILYSVDSYHFYTSNNLYFSEISILSKILLLYVCLLWLPKLIFATKLYAKLKTTLS